MLGGAGATDNNFNLAKSGGGTLLLSSLAASTYSGGTTIANGTLQLGIANGLPTGTIALGNVLSRTTAISMAAGATTMPAGFWETADLSV